MVFHPPVKILHEASLTGEYRTSLPMMSLILRGFLAGVYIGMGSLLMIICSLGVSATLGDGFSRLIMGMVFPVGLIMIVLTGAELFSGDAMLAPLAAWMNHTSWFPVFRLWILAYLGNLIGALFFAGISVCSILLVLNPSGQIMVSNIGMEVVSFATERCSYQGITGIISCFMKAVLCGWILNLAILLGICADDAIGKIAGIWFPSLAFIATGLEHAVTNLCLIPAGLLTASFLTPVQIADIGPGIVSLSWISMITHNLIPATIGNLIGGVIFAGLLYWIAFRNEIE